MPNLQTILDRLVKQRTLHPLTPASQMLLDRHLRGITSFYTDLCSEDRDLILFFEPEVEVFAANREEFFRAIPNDCWAKKAFSKPGGEGVLRGYLLVVIQVEGLVLINVTAPAINAPGGDA